MKLHDMDDALEVTRCKLTGSRFTDVNLARTVFNNIDASGWVVEDATLAGARLSNVNLTEVEISDCNLAGFKIDGVLVEEMLKAWRNAKG